MKTTSSNLINLKDQQYSLDLNSEDDDYLWAKRAAYWEDKVNSNLSIQANQKRRRKKPIVLILSGHGVNLRVERGALSIQNGFTHYPQKRETWLLFPGQSNLPERIVMLDGNGSLSFDVLTWLSNQQIPLVQINWQGEVITVLGGNSHAADARLIEAQRTVIGSSEGLKISLELIKQKIQGCQSTLSFFPESLPRNRALEKLCNSLDELDRPIASIELLRLIEGRAALAYFNYWQQIPLQWKGIARRPIPDEWRFMGARESFLSGSNRNATHPVNAMLNYVYSMLESQVRIAAVTEGLDLMLGFLHANRPSRVALVYDLMEPLRPQADLLLLKFMTNHKFSLSDFILNENGGCRLHPQLARNIATMTVEHSAIQKIVQGLVNDLQLAVK
ncbi:MAG: CRISPR-associated endonuclease Cas1 [Nitrosomonas sp.]|nr:CRISPR-associated endonuclease Cas1 [Nitrosomonas sp.]MBP7112873.1 CRISPR-associated endonuclease Cas1 [Nitrosomonas sp.]